MDIVHYLEPYKPIRKSIPGISHEESLAAQVSFFGGGEEWFRNASFQVVIVGVPESRNGADNRECDAAPNQVRKWLYAHRGDNMDITIGDAGNLLGKSINDRYHALFEVITFFQNRKSVVVVLGGSQDLSMPVFKALKSISNGVNLVTADAMLDVDTSNEDFSSRSWLSHLIAESAASLSNLSVLGIQNYYVAASQERFVTNRFFEILRLGQIRGSDVDKTEVPLRDAHFFSFDFRVIKEQPQIMEEINSPHGLEPNEACRICRYAGMGEQLNVFGLFEVPLSKSESKNNDLLAAQLVWHFIEGLTGRFGDYPNRSIDEYKYFVVPLDGEEPGLEFYHNQDNGRWWMRVPSDRGSVVMACSRDDYRKALKKEYPDRWWRSFMRRMPAKKDTTNC